MGNQARIEQLNGFLHVVVKVNTDIILMIPYPKIIKLHLSPLGKLAVFPNSLIL